MPHHSALRPYLAGALLCGAVCATSAQITTSSPSPPGQAATPAVERTELVPAAAPASATIPAAGRLATMVSPAVPAAWQAPTGWVLYLMPLVVLFASILAIRRIAIALSASSWSLADTLSEVVMVPVYDSSNTAAGATRTPLRDARQEILLTPELHASSSRMIAMMGMVSILFLFLGFGALAMFEFGATGEVPPSMERICVFLTTGMTLFAPYVINKLTSIFKLPAGGR